MGRVFAVIQKNLHFKIDDTGGHMRQHAFEALIVLGLASVWTAQALGQPAAGSPTVAQPASSDDILAEVVVTARRRSENIEDVPISIAVLSANQLQAQSVFSEVDLESAVPGLLIRETSGQNGFNFALRGQTVDAYTNSAPGVLTYVDEVQVRAHSMSAFYDLDNIQVLKGPQGTLFGRNATGGAVLFQTTQPSVGDDFNGYMQARYASYDTTAFESGITLPLGPIAVLRVAGNYTEGGAFVHNIYDNTWLGDQDERSGRLTLVVKPFDNLTNRTTAEFTHDTGSNLPGETYSAYQCGATNNGIPLVTPSACFYSPATPGWGAYLAAHPTTYPGGIVAFQTYQHSLGPWQSDINYNQPHDSETTFGANNTTWELSPEVTIKNIAGFNRSWDRDPIDYDGSPYPIFQNGGTDTNPIGEFMATRQYSDELQLQGKALDNALNYVIGGYYAYEYDTIITGELSAFSLPPVYPGSGYAINFGTADRTYAVFAQSTYNLGAGFSLTGGARYSWDNISASQLPGSIYFGADAERLTNSKPSFTGSLDYKLTPELLLYVTARSSWRSGGFNFASPPIPTTAAGGGNEFLAESDHDVEVGAKFSGRLFNMPVVLNVDGFNQWTDNVQRVAYAIVDGNNSSFTANVPKAEVTGFEMSGQIKPISSLEFGGSLVYTDARYTENEVTLFGQSVFYGPYSDTPRWSGTLYGQVSQAMPGKEGTLALRVDGYTQSMFYFSNLNATTNPGSGLPSYTLLNARVTWSDIMGTKLTAAAYGRNLTDREYFTGGDPTGTDLGVNTAFPGQRRVFGVELRYKF